MKAPGKCAFAHGVEINENVQVDGTQVVTTAEVTLDSVIIPVNLSVAGVLAVGDFVHLGGAGILSSDNRRIAAISEDGQVITIEYPFRDLNYTTAIDGTENANIPAGASLRKGTGGVASGLAAVLFGRAGIASGDYSFNAGDRCEASALLAAVLGFMNVVSGSCGFGIGTRNQISGDYAFGGGIGVTAGSYCQRVWGRQNIPDPDGKYIDIVGNSRNAAQSNAYTLDWSGNAWYAGNVECDGVILRSTTTGSARKFKLTVDDSGTLSAAEVTGND